MSRGGGVATLSHWQASGDGEDEKEGDVIVFFAPPVPNYAAPPPPIEGALDSTSPRRPTEKHSSSMPVKSVASLFEKAAPLAEAPKPAPQRLRASQSDALQPASNPHPTISTSAPPQNRPTPISRPHAPSAPGGPPRALPKLPTSGPPASSTGHPRTVSTSSGTHRLHPPTNPPPGWHPTTQPSDDVPGKQKRPRSGSFGDIPDTSTQSAAATLPKAPHSARGSTEASASTPALPPFSRPAPPPKQPAPPVPSTSSRAPARTQSVNAGSAAVFERGGPHHKSSLPPLPLNSVLAGSVSTTAVNGTSYASTNSDGTTRPSPRGGIPVLILPNGPPSTSPRELSSNSAPSSTNPSPRSPVYQTLPANFSLSTHQPTSAPSRPVPSRPTRSESLKSPSPGPADSNSSITAPSRPSLRVDDSISDNRVIQEIVITHEDYVKDLHTIQTVFCGPMKERSIVSNDVHVIFFSGISDLIRVEDQVLAAMKCRTKITPEDIAALFKQFISNANDADSLAVYIPFCARQDQTLKLMTEQINTNPAFAGFCEEVRKNPNCRGLSFDAFIIKPLQRLCKLPLLFRELAKGTPAENVEQKKLMEETQAQLEGILDAINKSTGAAEKLIELERNLSKKYPQIENYSLQHRKLLLDGEVMWVVKQTKDSAKLRLGHFWLLDQLLLFCKSPKELDFIMPLNTVSISKNLPPVQNYAYVLELIDMTAHGLVTRKLCCSDRTLYDNLVINLMAQ